MSSVGYVFVPRQIQTEDMDINDDSIYYQDNRNEIINILSSFDWLTKYQIKSRDADLFVVKDARPRFYTTRERENFWNTSHLQANEVEYEMINPSIFKLYLKNITDETFLTFTDTYSEQWLLGPNYINELRFAFSKDIPLSIQYRSENQAGGNVFVLNRDMITNVSNMVESNPDGSINTTVTLYFSPQKKLILGNYISITTALIIIIYLCYFLIRNFVNKNKQ
jgi:hypothetical protein